MVPLIWNSGRDGSENVDSFERLLGKWAQGPFEVEIDGFRRKVQNDGLKDVAGEIESLTAIFAVSSLISPANTIGSAALDRWPLGRRPPIARQLQTKNAAAPVGPPRMHLPKQDPAEQSRMQSYDLRGDALVNL